MKKVSTIVITSMVIFGMFLNFEIEDGNVAAQYTLREPIHIDGNSQFTAVNGVIGGSGTEEDPYIIEGWEIDINDATNPAEGIRIENTDAYFMIRDCYIHDGRAFPPAHQIYQGISLVSVQNGHIENCIISYNAIGIWASDISYNTITNNTIDLHYSHGIYIWGSSRNIISNNHIYSNVNDGIYLRSSTSHTISENNIYSNTDDGIELYSSSGNYIINNNISLNSWEGININSNSISNPIISNNITNNINYAIYIVSSYNNLIQYNSFAYNNGTTDIYDPDYIQAYDNSINYWNTSTKGNWWADWATPDVDANGIVDNPYILDGGSNQQDYFPLTEPTEGVIPGPIYINGNTDFASQATNNNWLGDGSQSDPYVIEGYDFNITLLPPRCPAIAGIDIRNTDVHFEIRNCHVYDGEEVNCYGIHLFNVTKGYVENCNVSNNDNGINLSSSFNNAVYNNNISNNDDGIYLYSSLSNNMSFNKISSNIIQSIGIHLFDSSNHTIYDNTISYNEWGIRLYLSSSNTMLKNSISNSSQCGIDICLSSNNNVTKNNISDHEAGIHLSVSSNNTLSYNNISSNEWAGISFCVFCNNNSIVKNNISNNEIGIDISSNSSNTIYKNNISNNEFGICIGGSNNIIFTNNIYSNNGNGIVLFPDSNNNTIIYNNITSNTNYGIYITSSNHSHLHHNNLAYNKGTTDTYNPANIQAYDDSINYWNTSTEGNWWADWTTPDSEPNGIVDNPYLLDGEAGGRDYYPLVDSVVGPPPDTIAPTITNLQPPDSSTMNDNTTTIGADYSDPWGIDVSSVVLRIDDIDVTASATVTESNVTYTPITPLPDGLHNAVLEVKNLIGNLATESWSFNIDATSPIAITDLATSNPTTNSITLTWAAPGDDGDVGDATGYAVKYSTSGEITEGNWASATNYTQTWTPLSPGNTETYVISGLSPGTKYWLAIKAYDEVFNYADISNSPNATTISGPTIPGTPTILTADPGDGYVYLTWHAPSSDGGSPIIKYTIYRGITSGSESYLTSIGNITYYNDTSITNDQVYYYKVSANNSIGEGPLSDEASATPGTGISLNPPSLIDPGTEDDDGIYYVNWSSVAGATGYVLEEDDNSGFASPSEVYSGSGISYQVSGKVAGTYYYRVKATALGLESDWSNVESIIVNVTDEDEDGLPDSWEQSHFGNLDQGPDGDYDGDGYSNLEEYQAGSDPTESLTIPTDIDGDGLPDSWEQTYFGNLDQGPEDDYDGDGHTNYDEYMQETSPVDANDPLDGTVREEEQDWTGIVIAIVITVIVIGIVVGYMVLWKKRKEPPLQPQELYEEGGFRESGDRKRR